VREVLSKTFENPGGSLAVFYVEQVTLNRHDWLSNKIQGSLSHNLSAPVKNFRLFLPKTATLPPRVNGPLGAVRIFAK
jgi:hypothetical protein